MVILGLGNASSHVSKMVTHTVYNCCFLSPRIVPAILEEVPVARQVLPIQHGGSTVGIPLILAPLPVIVDVEVRVAPLHCVEH